MVDFPVNLNQLDMTVLLLKGEQKNLFFFGLMMIVLPLMVINAKINGDKIAFDADIEFNEDNIIITHRNKDLVESKDWSWIKKIEARKDRIYFVLNEKVPFGLNIPKSALTVDQISFIEHKK